MGPKPLTREPHASADASTDRIVPAWHAWLRALADDAEAAIGAALAYEALDPTARDAFIDALQEDAPTLGVPRIALFAPFLSVEHDAARSERLRALMGREEPTSPRIRARALRGVAGDGDVVVAFVAPMYLDFVRVIACRFSRAGGFVWIRHDPLLHAKDAPLSGCVLDGVATEQAPVIAVIDDVAAAVVAQRRRDGTLPDSLRPLLDLFDARLRDADADGPCGGG
jgi:hypothetical protein